MRITSKGQVTIPIELREQAGLLPDTEVEFELCEEGVMIRAASDAYLRSKALVEGMVGKANRGMTTDEIMALTRGED